jgi:hypothetical protein
MISPSAKQFWIPDKDTIWIHTSSIQYHTSSIRSAPRVRYVHEVREISVSCEPGTKYWVYNTPDISVLLNEPQLLKFFSGILDAAYGKIMACHIFG